MDTVRISIPLIAYLSVEVEVPCELDGDRVIIEEDKLIDKLEAHKYNRRSHYDVSPCDWEIDSQAPYEMVDTADGLVLDLT